MEFAKEEKKFLKKFLEDAWFHCDVRNKNYTDRKLFNSIRRKLSQEI